MHLLIPYVKLPNHNDPVFEEFTYGDRCARGRRLRKLKPGDLLFFHTTIGKRKCITAYYEVARVMATEDVVKDAKLVGKYKNPHIARWQEGEGVPDDTIVFGDPITSRVLAKPLPLDRKLAIRLSLKIPFSKDRPENLVIASATRAWRRLTDKDVNVLLRTIRKWEDAATEESLSADSLLTTEEVAQVVEKHLEDLLVRQPALLHDSVKSVKRQVETDEGRVDIILETTSGNRIVVEIKLHRIGRNAVKQVRKYMKWAKKGWNGKKVRGIIVCEGVLPAFAEDVVKLKDIDVFCYGWQLKLRKYSKG